jgi:membrane protease subunit HflK
MSSRKNPWGDNNKGNGDKNDRPRKRNGSGGNYNEPPDLDDVLRKAQENLKEFFPGSFNGITIVLLSLLIIGGLWATSGFYIVNPGEHVVIQRFGNWNRTQDTEGLGYHWPSPLEVSTKVNVTKVREMSIGFASLETRSGASRSMDRPEESLMLTSDANIVDLDLIVQWTIKSAEDYLFNIKEQENTIKKVAESAIREVVGQTEMFPIITTARQQVATRAQEIMLKNLDEYKSGVNIISVLIQEAEVHPDVQSAFQDVQSAKQDAEDVQNRAEAYREDIIPRARGLAIQMTKEAEGYKESVIARATGDADRFNSIYNAYLKGEDVTKRRMYIETMENVLMNAQKIIMDTNAGNGVVPYLPLNEMKPAAGTPSAAPKSANPYNNSYMKR